MHPVLRKGDAAELEETKVVVSCVGATVKVAATVQVAGEGATVKVAGEGATVKVAAAVQVAGGAAAVRVAGRCASGGGGHCESGRPLRKWRALGRTCQAGTFRGRAEQAQRRAGTAPSGHSAERARRDSTGSPNDSEYGFAQQP